MTPSRSMSLNPGTSFPGKGKLSFCWICSWEDVKLGAASKRSNREVEHIRLGLNVSFMRTNVHNCLFEVGFLSLASKRFQANTNP